MSDGCQGNEHCLISLMSIAYYVADGPQTEDDHKLPCAVVDELHKLLATDGWEAIGQVCEDWLDAHRQLHKE